jgi:hypothetical protein
VKQTLIAIAQYGATAIVTGLAAAYEYYPQDRWIPAVLVAMGVIGIHVIPSQLQMASLSNQPKLVSLK